IIIYTDIKIIIYVLDLTRLTSVTADDVEKVKQQRSVGSMIAHMLDYYKKTYSDGVISIHDLCTIFYLTRPELFQTKRAKVNVVTEGEAAGCTVTNYTDEGNVFVCVDADVDAFRAAFIKVFGKMF